MKRASYFFLASVLTAIALPAFAVTINTSLPGMPSGGDAQNQVCGFVFSFYIFALSISGVLAFGAVVYGGVKYTLAAGNPSGQSEGKEWIKGALLGLLLLVGAYVILNIINPDITRCTLPTLSGINQSSNNNVIVNNPNIDTVTVTGTTPPIDTTPSPITDTLTNSTDPCDGVIACGGGPGFCSGSCPNSTDQCLGTDTTVVCGGTPEVCGQQMKCVQTNVSDPCDGVTTCGGGPGYCDGDCPNPNTQQCVSGSQLVCGGSPQTCRMRMSCQIIPTGGGPSSL